MMFDFLPKHFYFFVVIASSTLPVITWLVKRRPFILNDLFGMLLVFRVLTDLSCILTDFLLHNSNPTFFFSLPINGILILMLFHKHLQTPFSNWFFRISLLMIFCTFIYQLLFGSMYAIDSTMNFINLLSDRIVWNKCYLSIKEQALFKFNCFSIVCLLRTTYFLFFVRNSNP